MQEPPDLPESTEPEPAFAQAEKDLIFAAIAEHIHEHGPHDWPLVRNRPEFAHVIGTDHGSTIERRFWRWVDKVKEGLPTDRTRPHEGRAPIQEHVEWSADQAAAAAAKILPAPPPAAFFMRKGADGLIMIDMLEAAGEIWNDLQLARQQAFDGSEAGRPPSGKLLTQSALARIKALDATVKLHREIYDINDTHRRYRTIVDFIITELANYPDLHRRFLQGISDINSGQAPPLSAEGT
jgi:hypothetical protein